MLMCGDGRAVDVAGAGHPGLLLEEEAHGLAEVGARAAAEGHHDVDAVAAGLQQRCLHQRGRHVRAHLARTSTRASGRAAPRRCSPVRRREPPCGRDEQHARAPTVAHELGQAVDGPGAEDDLLGERGVGPGWEASLQDLGRLDLGGPRRGGTRSPSWSTTVTLALPTAITTIRSSPTAAPMTALMATKWVTTTVSRSSSASASSSRSRQATEVGAELGPASRPARAAATTLRSGRSSVGLGISATRSSISGGGSPRPRERLGRLAGAPQRAAHDRQRPERGQAAPPSPRPGPGQVVEPGIGVVVPSGRGLAVADEVQAGHVRRGPANRSSSISPPARRTVPDEPLPAEAPLERLVGHLRGRTTSRRSGWRGRPSTPASVATRARTSSAW